MTELRIKNFKGIKEFQYEDIKPITLLSGTNSGGKTSFIQSLLMIKQTIDFGNADSPIVLNGYFTRLGMFKNVVHKGEDYIEFEFVDSMSSKNDRTKKMNVQRLLNMNLFRNLEIITELSNLTDFNEGSINEARNRIISNRRKRKNSNLFKMEKIKYRIIISQKSNSDIPYIKELDISVIEKDTNVSHDITFKNTRMNNYDISTNSLLFVDNWNIYENVKTENFFKLFLGKNIYTVEEKSFFSKMKVDFSGLSIVPFSFRLFGDQIVNTDLINSVIGIMISYFQTIDFIGPLREEPKSLYLKETDIVKEIGIKGENAGFIFASNKDKEFDCPFFDDETYKYTTKKTTLEDGVNYWLNDKFGLAKKISANKYKENNIYELEVTNYKNITTSISSVGFGVSQIFPIIVSALTSPEDSILIFEQPEIHLHPKVQSLLFDFIYGIHKTSKNKKIIIETHSDHLINKYRIHRILSSDDIQKSIDLFFTNPEHCTLDCIEFDEFGNLDEWPVGFFDQSAEDTKTIFQKQLQKKLIMDTKEKEQ